MEIVDLMNQFAEYTNYHTKLTRDVHFVNTDSLDQQFQKNKK